jgi:multidrug efflux system membrane fusion protein
MTRLLRWFGLVTIVSLLLVGCSKKSPPAAENQAVPVLAVAAEQKTIPVQISGFGSVEEYAGVSLKAQITGVLTAVHFTEGQMVKKGDLLLSIDSRPFDAALKLAQAGQRPGPAQKRPDRDQTSEGLARQRFCLAKRI